MNAERTELDKGLMMRPGICNTSLIEWMGIVSKDTTVPASPAAAVSIKNEFKGLNLGTGGFSPLLSSTCKPSQRVSQDNTRRASC